MAKQKREQKPDVKLNKYYIMIIQKDHHKFVLDVRAETVTRASELVELAFSDNIHSYIHLPLAGELIQHGDTFRKNLKPEYND